MAAYLRDVFDAALQFVAAALVVLLLAVVTIGVVSRGLSHPFSWTDELSGFIMVWLACAGWMLASRRQAHIRINFFQGLLPQALRARLEIVLQLAGVLLGAVIAWKSIDLIHTNSDIEATTMPISTAWMYAPLFPAGLLTIVQAAADIACTVRRP